MPGASHLAVTGDARPGRILLAAQQVISLRRAYDSDIGDFVSHPNAQDKLPARLQGRCVSKSRDAGPVNFIGWFGGAGTWTTQDALGICGPRPSTSAAPSVFA